MRSQSKEKIPSDFILIRISATDCINCLIAYNQVMNTIKTKNLDSNVIFLVGNLPKVQQAEFFSEILGDKIAGKNIIRSYLKITRIRIMMHASWTNPRKFST